MSLTGYSAKCRSFKCSALHEDLSGRSMQQRISARSRAEVARFFAGTDLVEPGIVRPEEWRPDPGTAETARSSLWSAVGRKR
jgi:hypothetical protein